MRELVDAERMRALGRAVDAMIDRGLVDVERIAASFQEISAALYRYPAIDPAAFGRSVRQVVADAKRRRGDR